MAEWLRLEDSYEDGPLLKQGHLETAALVPFNNKLQFMYCCQKIPALDLSSSRTECQCAKHSYTY